jgi:hypothetical protein
MWIFVNWSCFVVFFIFFYFFCFFLKRTLDDNYFGEVFGKSGFFPNYYVEVVTEEDVPKKDRELFKKLDKSKEVTAAKEKEREDKNLQRSPVPRTSRSVVAEGSDRSPRRSQANDEHVSSSASPRGVTGLTSKSPSAIKKPLQSNLKVCI